MEKVFNFGNVSFGEMFVNREAEKKRITLNIKSGISTTLVSPRRWGKSSLVKQIAKENTDSILKFCFLDLFSVKDEQDFYRQYAEIIFKSTATKIEDVATNVAKYAKNLIPSFGFGNSVDADFELKFRLDDVKNSPEYILNLPEKIAIDKNIKIVICMDEFQNIADFSLGLAFQKKLRAHWQHHQHVVYVLYGSKLSMLTEMFHKSKMPFYKFGDTLFLTKIEKHHLVAYIIRRFETTEKRISESLAEKIVDKMECHPHYVQHYAQLVWYNTQTETQESDINAALEDLVQSYSPMFQQLFESLSRTQVNYLKAIADGQKDQLTSKEIIHKYDLGSGASVLKAIIALEKREVLDRMLSRVEFLDPVFKIWFKQVFRIYV